MRHLKWLSVGLLSSFICGCSGYNSQEQTSTSFSSTGDQTNESSQELSIDNFLPLVTTENEIQTFPKTIEHSVLRIGQICQQSSTAVPRNNFANTSQALTIRIHRRRIVEVNPVSAKIALESEPTDTRLLLQSFVFAFDHSNQRDLFCEISSPELREQIISGNLDLKSLLNQHCLSQPAREETLASSNEIGRQIMTQLKAFVQSDETADSEYVLNRILPFNLSVVDEETNTFYFQTDLDIAQSQGELKAFLPAARIDRAERHWRGLTHFIFYQGQGERCDYENIVNSL